MLTPAGECSSTPSNGIRSGSRRDGFCVVLKTGLGDRRFRYLRPAVLAPGVPLCVGVPARPGRGADGGAGLLLGRYRGRDGFRGESTVLTWLLQIAVNLVRDHARNRRLQFWKRAPSYPVDQETVRNWIPDGEIDPEKRILVREQVDAVWSATARLPERSGRCSWRSYVEEMELLEIAAVTGLKEGAVKVHLYRAVRAVRARVGRLR